MNPSSVDLLPLLNALDGTEMAKFRDYLTTRERFPRELTVEKAHKLLGPDFTRSDTWTALQDLADLGTGTAILGRKGRQSRLVWTVHPLTLAQAISNKESRLEVTSKEVVIEDPDEAEMVECKFNLRSDLEIELQIPKDMTIAERKRLSSWVMLLPICEE